MNSTSVRVCITRSSMSSLSDNALRTTQRRYLSRRSSNIHLQCKINGKLPLASQDNTSNTNTTTIRRDTKDFAVSAFSCRRNLIMRTRRRSTIGINQRRIDQSGQRHSTVCHAQKKQFKSFDDMLQAETKPVLVDFCT